MRYLCLICHEEAKLNALTSEEYQALVREALDYTETLRQSGHYVGSDALMPADDAVTLRFGSDKPAITDGPFAETKEQIGGFILIEAKDLNEAIRLASKMPPGRLGSIEVRPVKYLE